MEHSVEFIKTRQISAFIALLVLSAASIWGYPKAHPEFVLYRQAETLLSQGYDREALELAMEAASKGKLRPGDWEDLGQFALKRGQGADAMRYFELAMSRPDFRPPPSIYHMATQLEAAGFWQLALELYQAYPDRVSTDYELMHLADLERRDNALPQALAAYDRIAANPSVFGAEAAATARLAMAETLGWMGQYPEAIQAARAVLDQFPDNRTARLLLARLLSWSGDSGEAIIQYKLYLGEPS